MILYYTFPHKNSAAKRLHEHWTGSLINFTVFCFKTDHILKINFGTDMNVNFKKDVEYK
jgi:hypothetical protein